MPEKPSSLAGDGGMYWNTLGVAYFRVQDWDEATKALGRSMELRSDGKGDSYDWFFLAMIHARKDQKEEGRQWYDRAVAWFHITLAPKKLILTRLRQRGECLRALAGASG